MAVLSAVRRKKVAAALMREWSASRDVCPFLKAAVLEAVGDVDDYFEDNQAAMNSAMPASVRSTASIKMKADLYHFVMWAKYGRGPVPKEN